VSERERAYQYLLKLLQYRPRTVREARERLLGKGFAPDVVEETIARALEEGLLDDRAFASLYAEERVAKRPRAKALIQRELARKGISPGIAREAVEKALGGKDDRELAREALSRRLPTLRSLPREVALRRAFSYLLRRGFPPALAREVVRELLGDIGEDDPWMSE